MTEFQKTTKIKLSYSIALGMVKTNMLLFVIKFVLLNMLLIVKCFKINSLLPNRASVNSLLVNP